MAPSWESRFWTANYPPGVPATHDYPDVPLTRFLDDSARQFPKAPALDFMGNRWTYAELALRKTGWGGFRGAERIISDEITASSPWFS